MHQANKVKAVFGYYIQRLKAYPRAVTGSLLALPLAVLLNNYIPPLILADVLSRLSQHKYQAHHIWSSFGPQLVIYVATLLAGMAAWRLVDRFMWQLEGNVNKDIAEDVLRHMLSLSTDFHANNFTGSLVSQTNKLMGSYVRVADTTLFQVYPLIAGIVITAIILGPRAPLYVILLVLFSALFVALAFKISKPVRHYGAITANDESRQTGYLADAITNVVAIKSFSRSDYEIRRFRQATAITQRSLLQFAKAHQRQMNYLGTLSRSMGGLALVMAVVGVMVFNANIATVFLIFSYTSSIVDQLFGFGNQALRNYNRSIGDAFDMVQNLSQEPSVKDPQAPEKPRMGAGAITFRDVVFDHDSKDKQRKVPLFKDFNLQIRPGEKIGLVGHSGGGKTTLTKLIMRFMDIDGGEILIDGQNIARITQDDLRRFITYVPQEPLLFHRSLAENISYGKPKATQAETVRAAKMAHADEFINVLPQKYDTLVGERGIKLSGGQRQRIAIARAMLKDAPILVLDEATSALDSESEKLIQDALWKLMEGRTAIVIAHRLSTIQKMDRIVVLDEGRIAEEGTHKQLLAKKGTYAKLWAHQSGGFLEE
ncbi:MAG TPA: ABC transporter ATP-binding protein [Candidatus Saccharimonadales bacterium]|nr:ABC transporter ATP-binding protein [Candidatus Saccharimonadales bacterium]